MPFLIIFSLITIGFAWAIMWHNSSLLAVTRWHGSRRRRQVALTFDDGPDPNLTPLVLDVLARKGVKATFFCIGTRLRQHPDLARRIHAEGHLLANHSMEHDWRMNFWHPSRVARSMVACGRLLARHTGATPRFYRAPVGIKNPAQALMAWKLGLEFIGWARSARDGGRTLKPAALPWLARSARPGDVLLLHDGRHGLAPGHSIYENTREAFQQHLGAMIDHLRERGLEPVRLDALLETSGTLAPGARRRRKQVRTQGGVANLKSLIRQMVREHATPLELALAVGLGVMIGCTPLFGLHALIGLVASIKLRLNKLAVFMGTHVSNPLTGWLVVMANIEVGCRLLTGHWLALQTGMDMFHHHSMFAFGSQVLLYWVAGFPIAATFIAVMLAAATYPLFRIMQKRHSVAE